MRAWIARPLLPRFAEGVVQELPAFIGHAGSALQRAAKAVQFSRDVLQRWFHLASQCPAAVGEEQISGHTADDRSDDCCCYSFIVHARHLPGPKAVQVVCHVTRPRNAGGSPNTAVPRLNARISSVTQRQDSRR